MVMRGNRRPYTDLPCGVAMEKMGRSAGKRVAESREIRVRGEPSRTGGEGVKYAGLILLSQQQYVKVQGFIVADTE